MENPEKSGHESHLIRHSKAAYRTYADAVGSDNPQRPHDSKNQITPDLTDAGRDIARTEAEKIFSGFDVNRDALFFASSNEARALETADVYRRIAHEKRFEIIRPDKAGSDIAETIGEGEIRGVESLSLHIENTLLLTLANQTNKIKKMLLSIRAAPSLNH